MQTKWVLLSGLLSLSQLGVSESIDSIFSNWESLTQRELQRDEIRAAIEFDAMSLAPDWLRQANTTVQPALNAVNAGQPVPTNLEEGLQGLGLQVDNLQGGHLVPNMNAIMEVLRARITEMSARIQEIQNLLPQRVA